MKFGLMIAATLAASLWVNPVSARDTIVLEQKTGIQSSYDQRRRCKSGFVYDPQTKRCIRQKRGSY